MSILFTEYIKLPQSTMFVSAVVRQQTQTHSF